MTLRRTRRPLARGYTFVELLMSIMILSIGVTGVIAMQKVTVTSNQHAKDLAMATQLAQSWMDQLHADALAWNHPSAQRATTDLGDTVWLSNVQQSATTWVLPEWSTTRRFGPAFDARGVSINAATSPNDVKFCTHIRLSWLYQPTGIVTGGGLMRAEVRVFWLRDGQARSGTSGICSQQLAIATVGTDVSRYHFVYNTSAVRENTAQW
ncbi:MAG: prepilin-type N-terminal cleavage/methylation domain-containing protein [Polyangiaceae bacterium]